MFFHNNAVFTVSHVKFVLNYTGSVSIWISLPFQGVFSLVSLFQKGVVLRGHALPSIILWIKWGQRQGSWEWVSLRSSPMVAFVDQRNTNSKTGQSQRKLTCLILFLGGRRHSSFHLFPRAQIFGLHLTNKILSSPNSRLWLSLELGDADTQGGIGLVRRRRGVTWDRQASEAGK